MASAGGTAYLDLAGNRVKWHSKNHDTVHLDGSHFHSDILVATLAISALCLLSFFAIWMAVCCVCCRHRDSRKYLPWGTVWVPIFCMLAFFAVDLSNRILHELGMNLSSAYLGIDIGIGSFSSIADGLLQGYMIIHSPVDIKTASRLPRLLMILALVLYSLTSISTRGTQLWNVILQIYLSSAGGSDGYSEPSSQIYQDLGTAACGMILLFAIGYALFSIQYIRRLPTTEGKRKRIRWGVGILAAAFLVRNIVVFVFVLIYSQHQHIAALSAQLVYLAFYGLLSVAIYACVVAIARAQQADESSTDRARFSPLKQTDTGERFEPAYYSYPYIPKSG